MPGRRSLGLGSAAAVVAASMIGAGVFTTSGLLLEQLGSRRLVLLAWALGGGVALCGALCYGALGRRLPESGGEYLFLGRVLHPALGTMAGWISLLVGFSAPLALAAWGFGAYVKAWTPGWGEAALGTGAILACALLHGGRVRAGAWTQNAIVTGKIAFIVALVTFGLSRMEPPAAPPPPPFQPGPFALALVWISFAYSGWNAAVYVGGEVRRPERNLPRSLLIGCGGVVLLYLLLNAIFLYAAPVEDVAGRVEVGRVAAEALGGPGWGHAVAAVIAAAQFTSISAMVMLGPRVYARMAADGVLPRALAAPGGGKPPRLAILLQVLLALLMLWTATFDALLTLVGFTLGLSTAATVVALMVLRRREGPERVPVPGWPWIPALFLGMTVLTTVLVVSERPLESLWGVAVLAAGWLFWRIAPARTAPA